MLVVDIRCAKCWTPLRAASEPKPDTVVSCPACGTSDTYENASREAADYRRQRTIEGLNAAFRVLARRLGDLPIDTKAEPKRTYRFIGND